MKMSKVGNQTNSQDPQAVNSRVFVGNLNTFQCSKTDVERMFQRYGRLVGISMHKGFAFIQFTNPLDARSSCIGEDGRTVLGQTLDVNLVAEPKPHQIGRKRQNLAKTGNDWDYYYDSYYSSAFPSLRFSSSSGNSIAGVKRPRYMTSSSSGRSHGSKKSSTSSPPKQTCNYDLSNVSQLKVYSNPDVLICGNCREMFSELEELLQHKKTYCKLRFTCKCKPTEYSNYNGSTEDKGTLLCIQCKGSFENAWDLVVHVQAAHMVTVYELAPHKMKDDQEITTQDNHECNQNGFQKKEEESDIKDDEEKIKSDSKIEDQNQNTSEVENQNVQIIVEDTKTSF